MALRAVATGAIADPVLRWTPQQKAVVELRLNATASNRDKSTGHWSEMGAPLWISATFWDDEARYLSSVLNKGDRVSVEGTLVLETFHRRDGSEGLRYVLRFPRFLGVIPSRKAEAAEAQPQVDTGSIPMGYQGHPGGSADDHGGAQATDSSPF